LIIVDANLLLYAKLSDLPQHPVARGWLEGELNGPSRVGMPWESLTAFLRIATNPRIFPRPLSSTVAWEQVEEWLELPNVWVPGPVSTHASILGRLIRDTGATAKRIPDAHLAAIAIGHGLTLCTADADFRVYAGLKVCNPVGG
jgi:uncharacterized protein